MTASLGELANGGLNAYRHEATSRSNRETARRQDPARAAAPDVVNAVAEAETAFNVALQALREAVLVVTDQLATPSNPWVHFPLGDDRLRSGQWRESTREIIPRQYPDSSSQPGQSP
jgi:hypothetical protein